MKRVLACLAGASAGLLLTACAGAFAGKVIDPFPDDPNAPPPICTLCFSGSTVGPAQRATKGSNPTPDSVATNSSPHFLVDYDVGHVPLGNYPLMQSVLKLTTDAATAAGGVNSSGATLSVVDEGAHLFRLNVPALNLDVEFKNLRDTTLGDGRVLSGLVLTNFAYQALGQWTVVDPATDTRYTSEFVIGHRTPASAVPTNGSAIYSGHTDGHVFVPGKDPLYIYGDGSLTVHFATGEIFGTFNPVANGPWNSVSLSGSIVSGTSGFSGTTSVTSVPSHPYALKANATGFFDGAFYGPNAEEAGAVWSLHDGTATALGTIGVSR